MLCIVFTIHFFFSLVSELPIPVTKLVKFASLALKSACKTVFELFEFPVKAM